MNKLFYLIMFLVIGALLPIVTINNLGGTNIKLTLLDMFYPIIGAFLGLPLGLVATLFFLPTVSGATSFLTFLAALRILPFFSGVLSFTKNSKLILLIPLFSIIAFLTHPVGVQVWYFALLWCVPFWIWDFRKKSLFARSLSTTLISHSIGGAVWIWAFPTTAQFWIALIPVVIIERFLLAVGMSAMYLLVKNVGYFLSEQRILPAGLNFHKK